jgi:hypothetical protein
VLETGLSTHGRCFFVKVGGVVRPARTWQNGCGQVHDLGRRPVVRRECPVGPPGAQVGAEQSAQACAPAGALRCARSPTAVIECDGQRRSRTRQSIAESFLRLVDDEMPYRQSQSAATRSATPRSASASSGRPGRGSSPAASVYARATPRRAPTASVSAERRSESGGSAPTDTFYRSEAPPSGTVSTARGVLRSGQRLSATIR